MTNKIPKEIEESLTAQNIYNEFELKAGIHIGTEERLIIQAIQKGFKAGQKQSEDAFKEMIKDFKTKVSEHTQYVGDYNTCSCHQCEGSTDVSRVLRLVNKLILSKIGDNSEVKK